MGGFWIVLLSDLQICLKKIIAILSVTNPEVTFPVIASE